MTRLPALLLLLMTTLLLAACGSQPVRDAEPRTDSDASQLERRAATRVELAAGYFARGQHDVALDELKQALALQPNSRDALNLRALVLAAMGETAAADEAFKRTLQIYPRDADTLHNQAWFWCQQGRVDAAMLAFDEALAQPAYRGASRTWLARGACDMRHLRWAEAERSLVRAFELDPGNPAAAFNLAEVLLQLGQGERARFYGGARQRAAGADQRGQPVAGGAHRASPGQPARRAALGPAPEPRVPAIRRGPGLWRRPLRAMSDDADSKAGSAGALLAAARRKQGLHIVTLAAQLKVSPARLEALEAERWQDLPDPTHARALATSVCRVLGIDAAAVLAGMPKGGGAALERVSAGLNEPVRSGAGWPANGLRWLLLVLLLLAVAAACAGGRPLASELPSPSWRRCCNSPSRPPARPCPAPLPVRSPAKARRPSKPRRRPLPSRRPRRPCPRLPPARQRPHPAHRCWKSRPRPAPAGSASRTPAARAWRRACCSRANA